ncbi:gamma-glutamyl-gamma-aminobutyrate hydrolase family protein [Candidatus Woesearchaeota archaeon]|nr:gamma-glutamyl-gamma-aminobutyrate hydrolase family protein [Candidatus Woesearchaeota archaeon]MBW3017670.1 gamma-glutamyl-gamma-aminobutyrate hydrolase family protein [Candidatus Woesearchaeota archaeon]
MILVINNRSHFIYELQQRLTELGAKFIVMDKQDTLKPKQLKKFKGIILSGGPMALNKKQYLEDINLDLQILLDAKVPILGVCLGHQLIGDTFGAKTIPMKKFHNEKQKIEIVNKDDIFADFKEKKIAVQEAHHNCLNKLPPDFILLAKSTVTKIEAMKHLSRPIYGVQFHPEVSGDVGKKILKNFLKICKEI